jgi:hypothetical protein
MLMPTLYRIPGGQPVFDLPAESLPSTNLDLLFITDRAPPGQSELADAIAASAKDPLACDQQRARRIAFGSAQICVAPGLDRDTLFPTRANTRICSDIPTSPPIRKLAPT